MSSIFTKEDIALAKDLKAFGVTEIENVEELCWVVNDPCYMSGRVPYGAFKSIPPLESAFIDDIIKEGEDG